MRLTAENLFELTVTRDACDVYVDEEHDALATLRAFQKAMDTSACPVLIIDRTPAGQPLRYANTSLERLLGYGGEKLAGREWSSLFTPVGMESTISHAQTAVDLGIPVNETLRAERLSGEVLWLDARMYPIHAAAGLVNHYVGILHDVTYEHRSREELEHRAFHDALTGLANRHLLRDRFDLARAQAQRCSGSLAVVILDMNDFKLINDRHGHHAGDDLLRCVGARLSAAVRGEDTVARLGGDEFVLLLADGPHDPDSASAIIERVAEALTRPIKLEQQQLVLACCAGVGRYPEDGSDLETLLKAADMALYRAKARAKRPAREG
jgi:diguanylate cyclase (GGDEF)-like protein/PAS domain S-box-containing protein